MKLKESRKIGKRKILYSLIIALAVIAVITASVYAAFLRKSDTVQNTFSPAVSKIPEIQEIIEDNAKKDIKISVGKTDYPVYVRVALVFNWQEKGNKNGVIYFSKPVKDKDYTLKINESKWEQKSDGYYYYKDPVPSNGVTDTSLITECKPISNAPDGYALSVNVIAQTVQAVGHTDEDSKGTPTITALEDAWGVALGQ